MGSILKFGAKCSSTPGVPTGAFCLPTLKCINDVCAATGIAVLQEGAACSTDVPVSALCVDGLSCYNSVCTKVGGAMIGLGGACSSESGAPTGVFCQGGLACKEKVCVLKEKEATTTSAAGYYAPTTVAPPASTKNLYDSAADRTLVASAVFGVLAAFAL
ncbi:hypothetical protein CcCBS67573_g08679 [Chytriomyces confervae]|uniref:Uncharacterized protein n=1 Tax=Chytriomyces confervae TaxID=246404 RepID=A0A507EJR0_9FUNG|nr:hypothetical protein HDU80_010611 [Chytriomyces hyalinus]TPX63448.1 hypothetical protein CcCBS67573_g08679 [Chytriomyces confervae]